ncbi:Pimeloyl-ACP methyl ester carboxylesterase [Natronincola peptidivorans]|uniref:Pimeloyl-ACP methyl ester carboxylesterase n=1 Tax=Natronincola peptidivorans TaxID=426128 RepID=A0A1I0BXD8_9FIRM|nr:alpha/beta hydrolase [Natronincola peptidivorans]SET11368.1 Pimeloyl-ACP methyl ester carboxylesterase [Natronincola peptidivorans]
MPYFKFQGKNIYFEDQGSGEALILLPGNTSSSAAHKSEIEHFSQKFRVICPDYLGYGRSDRMKELPRDFWWANAEMIVSLLKHLDTEVYYCIGTSGGGIIALNIAILEPNKVLGVVADSIPGIYLSVEDVGRIIEDREKKILEESIFWKLAHGEDWEEIIRQDNEILLINARKNERLNKGNLSEIVSPILFTASIKDSLIEAIEEKVIHTAKQTKDWKIVFYSNGEHPVMWSKATEFRQEVEKFISLVKNHKSIAPTLAAILEEG